MNAAPIAATAPTMRATSVWSLLCPTRRPPVSWCAGHDRSARSVSAASDASPRAGPGATMGDERQGSVRPMAWALRVRTPQTLEPDPVCTGVGSRASHLRGRRRASAGGASDDERGDPSRRWRNTHHAEKDPGRRRWRPSRRPRSPPARRPRAGGARRRPGAHATSAAPGTVTLVTHDSFALSDGLLDDVHEADGDHRQGRPAGRRGRAGQPARADQGRAARRRDLRHRQHVRVAGGRRGRRRALHVDRARRGRRGDARRRTGPDRDRLRRRLHQRGPRLVQQARPGRARRRSTTSPTRSTRTCSWSPTR